MRTINQIVKVLNDFATGHDQVKSFGSGPIQNFATSGVTDYVAMWVDFEPAIIEENTFSVVLRVYLMERQLKGQENLNDALSDTFEIAKDLEAYLKAPITFYDLVLDLPLNLNPVFEKNFDDETNGWWFDLQFRQANTENRCQIPFNQNLTT